MPHTKEVISVYKSSSAICFDTLSESTFVLSIAMRSKCDSINPSILKLAMRCIMMMRS